MSQFNPGDRVRLPDGATGIVQSGSDYSGRYYPIRLDQNDQIVEMPIEILNPLPVAKP